MTKGLIFDVVEFAVQDGPGIRTTVFLKGCPLKCMWCHNPEGISFKKELMVSTASCIKCRKCDEVCNNPQCCISCGRCIIVCPLRLRKICGTEIEPLELASRLLKDKDFLNKNGGGITFSGGEALSQPEFLYETLILLGGVHKAIETSGYAHLDVFKRIVNILDLVIIDIKHTDPKIHKKYTGVDNELILRNLDYLCNSGKRFIVRIPLIPGVNDYKENIEKTASLLVNAKNLERVELLPYHKTAGAKYPMVGRKYEVQFDVDKKPEINVEIFEKFGIRSMLL